MIQIITTKQNKITKWLGCDTIKISLVLRKNPQNICKQSNLIHKRNHCWSKKVYFAQETCVSKEYLPEIVSAKYSRPKILLVYRKFQPRFWFVIVPLSSTESNQFARYSTVELKADYRLFSIKWFFEIWYQLELNYWNAKFIRRCFLFATLGFILEYDRIFSCWPPVLMN